MSQEEVQLKFGIDVDSATANLDTLRRDWREAMKDLGKSPDEIKAFINLTRDAEQGKVAIGDLDEETRQLLTTYQSLAQVAKGREVLNLIPHAKIEQEIKKARAAYEDLRKSGKLTGVELAQAHLKMEQQVAELEHKTNGWAEAIGQVKYQLAGFAAGTAGLVAAARQAIDFESAMADVRKVVNVTDDEFNALTENIKQLSTELPISAEGLAAIAAQAGQLGIAGGDIEAFTRLVAKMGTAFNLLPEQAGEAIAKLKNVYQISIAEVASLGDAINTLGNNTAAKEKDIVDAMTRIGGTARQFGLATDEAAALSAAFIALGKPAEVAATGINALLSKLQTAEVGTAGFKEGLDRLGLSAEQLADDVRDKPQQALLEFLKTLERLDTKSRAEILTRMFGAEYQDDISILVGSLRDYERALGLVSDKQATAGALEKEFQARMETTAAQIEKLKNAFTVLVINLGQAFLPMVATVASGLTDVTTAMANFIATFPELSAVAGVLATIATSVAGLKVAFAAFGVLATKSAAAASAGYAALTAQITATTLAANKMNAAFSAGAAFLVGWEIGKALSEEFATVRQAGVAMAEGMTHAFEQIRYGWEAFQAAFSDDTLDAATARHEARVQQISEVYADMYRDAAQVPAKLAETHEAAAQTLSAGAAKVAQSLDEMLADVGKADAEIGSQIADTQKRLAAWPALYQAVANSMAPLEQKTQLMLTLRGEEKQLNETLAALELKRTENNLRGLDLINKKEQEALNKKKQLVVESSELLKKYKLDMEQLLTGISADARDAIAGLQQINEVLKAGTSDISKQADGMGQALVAALGSVSNSTELAALQKQWNSMGHSGEITQEVWTKGLQSIREKGEELKNADMGAGLRDVEESAENAKPALETFREKVQEVKETTEQFGEAARAMAGGVAGIINATTQSMHGLSKAAGEAFEQMQFGNQHLSGLDDLSAKWQQAAQEARHYASAQAHLMNSSFGSYFADLYEKAARVKEAFYGQKVELEKLTTRIDEGGLSLRELIQLSETADSKFNLLDSNDLSGLRSAIQSARQELERMNEEADNTIGNLQDRLDQLRDNQDAINARRYEKERADLQRELDLAREFNNLEAVRKYEEALKLLRQIRTEEKNQAAKDTRQPPGAAPATRNPDKIIELRSGNDRTSVTTDNPDALLRILTDAKTRSY